MRIIEEIRDMQVLEWVSFVLDEMINHGEIVTMGLFICLVAQSLVCVTQFEAYISISASSVWRISHIAAQNIVIRHLKKVSIKSHF